MSENTRENGGYSKRGKSSGWQSASRSGASRRKNKNFHQSSEQSYRGDSGYRSSQGKWHKSDRSNVRSGERRWEHTNRKHSAKQWDSRRDTRNWRDDVNSGEHRDENRNSYRRWENRDDYRGARRNNDNFRGGRNRDRDNGGERRWNSSNEHQGRRRNWRDHDRREWSQDDRHWNKRDNYPRGEDWRNDHQNDRNNHARSNSSLDYRRHTNADETSRRGNWGHDNTARKEGFAEQKRHHRGGERLGENHRELRERRSELIQEIPASITSESLDPATRAHLRNLNRENSEIVARHLAYAGEMVDIDPEVAYRHAKAAFARAARIDVVREALGITAYLTGRYQEALSELRTYRRMSNDFTHVAMEADAERGMGRSEKALNFIAEIPLSQLDPAAKIELALVTSGARADVGDSAGGLAVVEKIIVKNLDDDLAARVELVRADRLAELGREEEAQALRTKWNPIFAGDEDEAMVLDLEEVFADEDFSEDVRESEQTERGEQARRDNADEVDEIDTAAFDELFAEVEVDSQVAAQFTAELAADAIAERDAQNAQSELAADSQNDSAYETADNASAPAYTSFVDANLQENAAENTDLGESAAEESVLEESAAEEPTAAESAVVVQEVENTDLDDVAFADETALKTALEDTSIAKHGENEESVLDGVESVAGENRFADIKKTLQRLNIELADDDFSADEFDDDDDFFDDDFAEDDLDFADDDIDWDAEFADDDFSDHFFDDDADYDR